VNLPEIKRNKRTGKFRLKTPGDYIVMHGDHGTRTATWDGSTWIDGGGGGQPIQWREKELYEVNGPIPGTEFEREPTQADREKLARDTAWAYTKKRGDIVRTRIAFDGGWAAALKWDEDGRP